MLQISLCVHYNFGFYRLVPFYRWAETATGMRLEQPWLSVSTENAPMRSFEKELISLNTDFIWEIYQNTSSRLKVSEKGSEYPNQHNRDRACATHKQGRYDYLFVLIGDTDSKLPARARVCVLRIRAHSPIDDGDEAHINSNFWKLIAINLKTN